MPSVPAHLRDLLWTGTKFGLVGLTTVGIYFAVLALARPMVQGVVALSLLAYTVSAVFNFAVQAHVTFGTRPDGAKLRRYILMHLLCMGMNSGLMHLLVDRAGLGLYGAQVLVTGVIAATSFLLSRFWVYR